MYKIYINDRLLTLCDPLAMAQAGTPADGHLVARYPGKPKFILNYVDLLEKGSPQVEQVTLFHTDVEQLWRDFSEHYRIVAAAGGVVRNFAGQWLLIYRLGSWDLPKGKVDEGETIEAAAVREVQEETGIQHLTVAASLPTTYHTYRDSQDRRVLKPTYWFLMDTPDTDLTPQAEEGIEQACWMSAKRFFSEPRPVYNSIFHLLKSIEN